MPITTSVAELFPLIPRDRCTQCTTVCAGATFGQFFVQRHEPINATELCGCGHPYWQHYITQPAIRLAPNASSVSAVARGNCQATGCGGFIPLSSMSTTMTLQTLCACGAPYLQHTRDIPDVAPPPRISNTHAAPGHLTPAQIETPLPALPTGVTTGIPTPLAAVRTVGTYSPAFVAPVASSLSASQQRQVSATRTRRAGTSGFGYNPSQGPTPGPPTTIPSRKGKRTMAMPLPSKLKCAIIPFANRTNSETPCPPNMFRLTDIQRDQLLPQLAKWNLVIPLTEPEQSETIWEVLDETITHHLQAHNITIEQPPALQDHPYFNLSWSVCQAARTNKTGISNYTPSTPPQYAFTFNYLQGLAWPDPIEEGYGVFFVAPRKNHLRGPLPESSDLSHHPCWPWRVVSPFHDWLRFGGENDLYQANSCIVECQINDGGASGDDDEFQPSPVTRKRYLPPIVHPRPVRRVRLDSGPGQSQPPLPSFLSESRVPSSSQAVVTEPLFTPDSPPAECSRHDSRSPTPPPILLRPALDDRLPDSVIRQWQDSLQIKREVTRAPTPHIKGPKATDLATFLISAVYALAKQEPVPEKDNELGVTSNHIKTLYSLFKPFPTFIVTEISVTDLGIDTSGNGLLRTVFQSALQQSTKSHRWIPSVNKGYHKLHLSRNPDLDIVNQTIDYKVEGHIAALFTTHLAIGPDPISPFVILAATLTKLEEFEFDVEFARAMIPDEDLLNKVEHIINLPVGKIDATDMSKDWLHSLASDIELPANHLTQSRPVEAHQKMQKQMLAYYLIGDRDPWKHTNFQAFKEGFNSIASGPFLKFPLARWDEPRYLQRFLATLYNRRIEIPGDVIPLIRWHATDVDDPATYNLCCLFIMRFTRWIEGIGHPRETKDNLVTSQQYAQARLDRGLRARLFHQVVTGCSLKLNLQDEFINIRLAYRPLVRDEDTIKFSVCTNTIYLNINKEIARLLVQPGLLYRHDAKGKEVCTEFDMWWHAQMILGDDFNRA
ncbi:hypothetical protein F5887DRAFT_1082968 [Amanita rubescens]|nr:hypothetical protein F5887DRAFT_1082968 [Amanita rubescens]